VRIVFLSIESRHVKINHHHFHPASFRGPQSKINKTKAAYCILLPSKINEALSRSRGKPTWPTWVRDGENQNKDAEDWISNVWNVESTTFVGRWQNPLFGWWSHHSWLLTLMSKIFWAAPNFSAIPRVPRCHTYHRHVAMWSRAQCWHRHGSCGAQGAAFDLDACRNLNSGVLEPSFQV
jgi:hypothetical protein